MKSLFRSTLSGLGLALALAWVRGSDAVTIDASGVSAPASALGQYQTLEKTWTVSSSSGLRNLLVQVPGTVFIDYDATLTTGAKVVLTGDSETLINLVEVVSWKDHEDDGLALRFRDPDQSVRGHLLTQMFVSDKQVLQNIQSVASAGVLVSDNVLVTNNADAAITLETHGPGDVHVTSSGNISVKELSVVVTGSGDIQVQAPSIEAQNEISMGVYGSGDVAILAEKIAAGAVRTKNTGSGDVYIQADSLTATEVDTFVSGSGTVTFSREGKCTNQDIKVTGSGSVAAGSIVSQNSHVGVFGSGDVLVQATESLSATISGSGSIKYVNETPKQLVVKDSHFRKHSKHSQSKVKQAHANSYRTYHSRANPQRIPQLITINYGDSWDTGRGNWWHFDDDDSSDAYGYWGVTSKLATALPSSVSDSSSAVVLVLVGVVMGVVGVVVRKIRNRAAYDPIV